MLASAHWLIALSLVSGACASTAAPPAKRTMPSPLVAANLPPRPDAEAIAPAANWAVPMEAGQCVPDGRAGILISQEKALRAARYLVSYDELRSLYEIDLRTWGRERQIYERTLEGADQELARAREAAERTWWERHSPQVAMVLGVVIGAAVTVSIVAAVHQVDQPAGATP